MWLEDTNPRKQTPVDRETKVSEIMRIFSKEADLDDQYDDLTSPKVTQKPDYYE